MRNFKSEGSRKKLPFRAFVSFCFKALWKSQDLRTERSLHFSELSLSAASLSFNNIIKAWGTEGGILCMGLAASAEEGNF